MRIGITTYWNLSSSLPDIKQDWFSLLGITISIWVLDIFSRIEIKYWILKAISISLSKFSVEIWVFACPLSDWEKINKSLFLYLSLTPLFLSSTNIADWWRLSKKSSLL